MRLPSAYARRAMDSTTVRFSVGGRLAATRRLPGLKTDTFREMIEYSKKYKARLRDAALLGGTRWQP